MDDMINRIIELDRQAKESLAEAKQLKINSKQRISGIKEKKRSEYLERARANIKALEKDEKSKSFVKLKVIEETYQKTLDRIENVFNASKDKWISTIVERVIQN